MFMYQCGLCSYMKIHVCVWFSSIWACVSRTPSILLQGDPPVDIKTNVVFQYMLLKLKRNLSFDVNRRLRPTWWVTLFWGWSRWWKSNKTQVLEHIEHPVILASISTTWMLTGRRGWHGADELRGLDALPNHVRNFRRPGMEERRTQHGRWKEGRLRREREYPSQFPIGENVIILDNGKEGHREISLKVRANKALC